MSLKIKEDKPLPSTAISPKDARLRLTIDNGQDYIEIYLSSEEKIQYLKPEQLTAGIANLLDCGVAWPDDETMVIGDLVEMAETFTPQEIDVLPICNVEIELAEQQPNPDVIVFPGNYLHSLQSWKLREMKKDFVC